MHILASLRILDQINLNLRQLNLQIIEILLLYLRQVVDVVDVLLLFQDSQQFLPCFLVWFETETFFYSAEN
jgi:hypothetical protein